MKRIHLGLVGLLVVQIALTVLVFWPRSAEVAGEEPLLPGLTASEVIGLTIMDGEGSTLRLEKSNDGWALAEADGFPVDAERVVPVVEQLVGLNTQRLVTRTEASHRPLQVAAAAYVRRVDLYTTEGQTVTIYLGSSPRYGLVHFRLEGQPEVYAAQGLNVWDIVPSANHWIDTQYLSVGQDTVRRLTVENSHGTLVFEKTATEAEVQPGAMAWTLVGLTADEPLDVGNVNMLVSQASSVTMVAPLGKSERERYGLNTPNATVTLETTEETITLRVGAQDPDSGYYVAKVSTSPYYVHVAATGVDRLVESSRDSLLQVSATPAAQETDPGS
jgi:hypothetical protein